MAAHAYNAGLPRRSQSPITDAERAEIIRLRVEDELSTHKIAERVVRAQSAVWRVLDAAGIPRQAPGWPKDAASRRRDRAGAS